MVPPANTTTTAAPTGCFKCGRPGHWSRDCPSSSSSSSSAPFSTNPPSSQQQNRQQQQQFGAPAGSWKSGKPPLKPAPPKPALPRKRPKLTPDLLLSNDGLGYALEHFPRMVKIQGPGHEVDDLKRFLEAYVHWHSLILPYFSFNQFVEKVAKVGASRRVRNCVNDLKDKVARGDDLKLTPEERAPDCADGDQDISLEKDEPRDRETWEEALPTDVNEDVFDEFYKQATDEPCDTPPQATFPDVSLPMPTADDSIMNSATASSSCISEDQKLRMEANRLKALERAKARSAALVAT